MANIRTIFFTVLLLIPLWGVMGYATAQTVQENGVIGRLQAISNRGTDFYNVDGISVTQEVFQSKFSKANILKMYGQFIPGESSLEQSDLSIEQQNFVYERVDSLSEGIDIYTTYYFIEEPVGSITAITYSSPGKNDKKLQRELNPLILGKKVPASVFSPMVFNTIDFAGRRIELSYLCQWTKVNSVQWPYHGQINWSVHRDRADAELSVDMQRRISAHNFLNPDVPSREYSETPNSILSDEMVDVIFEGTPIKARKVVFSLGTGLEKILGPTGKGEGTKELTIYYVTAPVRGNWVSCVMSHWNNDIIGESGLPELLEKIMKLK